MENVGWRCRVSAGRTGAARADGVGSIDPVCELNRGTHWPDRGHEVDWSSRRGSHLGQRSNSPHQKAGHMDASDPIPPQKALVPRGPSTYGSRVALRLPGATWGERGATVRSRGTKCPSCWK